MPSRKELANAVRVLAMDAVQKAKSGHPGAAMGMADLAEVLWNDFMTHNPANPRWPNRDRFVLSNGHASILLYAVLHLSGYDLGLEELKNFRRLDSLTPGHPEYGITPGVETTTGPLGQGFANAVGMALGEKLLAAEFNREKFNLVDHYTYCIVGDGCLMEGISHEAASLAGLLRLGKLITLWDNNGISIDGPVKGWFADNTLQRFEAYGWQVEEVDGHDPEAVKKALAKARKAKDCPSLISCKTCIACYAPTKEGSASSHGAPLGEEEIEGARRKMGWKYPPFEIPSEIRVGWDARLAGQQAEKKWNKLLENYKLKFPEAGRAYEDRLSGELPPHWREQALELARLAQEGKPEAAGEQSLRSFSRSLLRGLGESLPALIGGSADLTDSVGAKWEGAREITPESSGGNYIHYGVREFAMGAIMNGLSLHGGFIPYAGTFMVFADYAKNALRLSALMGRQVIWVLTHDSIGVGEDGPTHQPVEQLCSLRSIPGLQVWRPCDAVETAAAWINAVRASARPSCIVLPRQNVPGQDRRRAVLSEAKQVDEPSPIEKIILTVRRGGYILRECKKGEPELILLSSGSEVSLAMAAAELLEARDVQVRVVSMPCAEIFDEQEVSWRAAVLPSNVRRRIAVEASMGDWWRKYVGLDGAVVGMRGFGKSAPMNVLYKYYGFTVENVVKVAERMLGCKEKDKEKEKDA
ncbi:MAG: transketolase [Deltaproteobacteria bacterium]|jgi:transketolase|nr:transketolase [Deltaproteobacteria bacterium]